MTSDRAYRKALPHEIACGELERCMGAQFDPEIVPVFLAQIEEFRKLEAIAGPLHSAFTGRTCPGAVQPVLAAWLERLQFTRCPVIGDSRCSCLT